MSLVVWVCLVLVNGQGFVGLTASTQAECEEERAAALTHEQVVASSVCAAMTVEGKPAKL